MLMVLVKEAKNLVPVARGAANADPFCKWYDGFAGFSAFKVVCSYGGDRLKSGPEVA